MKFVETKYVFIGKTSQVLWMCVHFLCPTSLSNHLVYSGCHQPPKPAPSRGSNPWPKQTSHWLDWLRSNQIQKSYVTGFRVYTYTMHARIHNSQAQAEAHTHTFKHTHLVTQTHTHTLMFNHARIPPHSHPHAHGPSPCECIVGNLPSGGGYYITASASFAQPRSPNRVTVVTAVEN